MVRFRRSSLAIWALVAVAGCSDDEAVGLAAEPDAAGAVEQDVAVEPQIRGSGRPATGAYVELTGVWTGERRAQIEVWIGNFDDLLGLAGHLRYDPQVLSVHSLEALPVPEPQNGEAASWTAQAVARDTPPGRILAGAARLPTKPHPFLPVSGAAVERQRWLVLDVEVLAPGAHTLAFDPASTVARDGSGQRIAVQWSELDLVVPPTEAP